MAKKKAKRPQEELAPAYFVQYSALWCILLGFFVMLLSLGNTQMGPGTDGLGEVRDAFGVKGGLGLLPYAKNALFGRKDGGASSFRIRDSAPQQAMDADGYIRGTLWKKGLADTSMLSVMHSPGSPTVLLRVPVRFSGYDKLERDTVELLEMLCEVFISLHHYEMEVLAVYEDSPDKRECQRIAMLRAALVARFLCDTASLSPERVWGVGFSDTRLLDLHGIEHAPETVLISLRRKN